MSNQKELANEVAAAALSEDLDAVKSEPQSSSSIKMSAVSAATKMFGDANNASSKTPVSLLQEICSKSQMAPPNYELISAEGQMHQPLFVYKCSLATELEATAKGASKKKAKHASALAVLHLIRDRNMSTNETLAKQLGALIETLVLDPENVPNGTDAGILEDTPTSQIIKNVENGDTAETSSKDLTGDDPIKASVLNSQNPVGELIELAQRLSMRPPDFEFGDEEGPAHNRIFTCFSKFGDIKETGYGKAKKCAKRQAAVKLLYKIKTSEQFAKNAADLNNKHITTAADSLANEIDLLKLINNNHNNAKKNLPNIYNQLKASIKPLITQLLASNIDSLDKDFTDEFNKQFLDKLAIEEKFEYKIYKKVVKDSIIIITIQFQTNPTCVFNGAAEKLDSALNCAVSSALYHLKIMCSR